MATKKTDTAAAAIAAKLRDLRKLMDARDTLAAKLKPVEDGIAALRDGLLNEFTEAQLSSTTAEGLRVSRTTTVVPTVVDATAFLAFATRKANWDLLAKSASSPAWRERLEAGKKVPGVEPFTRVSLRVDRVAGKRA